jgi:UDP-N-acetylglucosamine:LPS N-acetylglucosamine transferase
MSRLEDADRSADAASNPPARLRVLLVGSSGGHLDQLLLLENWLSQHDVAIATFLKPDAVGRIKGWRSYGLYWPTNRHVPNLLRNTAIAFKVLKAEKPDVVISSGAAGALPFFVLARPLAGSVTVFIECLDRITDPTLTARLVRPFTDHFIAQWPTQLKNWPRRTYLGLSR